MICSFCWMSTIRLCLWILNSPATTFRYEGCALYEPEFATYWLSSDSYSVNPSAPVTSSSRTWWRSLSHPSQKSISNLFSFTCPWSASFRSNWPRSRICCFLGLSVFLTKATWSTRWRIGISGFGRKRGTGHWRPSCRWQLPKRTRRPWNCPIFQYGSMGPCTMVCLWLTCYL